jgi:transcriptional regulator with XRE-family HTH domain
MSSSSHGQMYDDFGAYVRSQRQLAKLTLRQAAELASISNPYLSQIEHGLTLPSIAVIGALAEALSVSVETLLLQAAGVTSAEAAARASHTEDAIRQDPRLDDLQKQALLAVLASFVGSSPGAVPGAVPDEFGQPTPTPTHPPAPRRATPRPSKAKTKAALTPTPTPPTPTPTATRRSTRPAAPAVGSTRRKRTSP